MSSEGDNAKNLSSEVDEKSENESVESNPSKDEKDVKPEKENDEEKVADEDKSKEKTEEKNEKLNDKKEAKSEENVSSKNEVEEKEDKKKDKKEAKKEDTEGEGSEKGDEGSEEDEEKKGVPLLDQPLEQSGPRERKKVQRFEDFPSDSKESTKADIPNGSGTQLGEIPRIDASISRFKNDDLKLLHRLLFKTPGKTNMIKKNIKKFNGFEFKKDSEEYARKLGAVQKFEIKQLKSICEMLDLLKNGSREEIAERILEFLIEPKDSGKPVGGGRPKRTAAVRANNRGYSSHDDSYSSDERHAPRARRDKGKRPNLKEESSSESDEDFHPSDASDDKPRVKAKRTPGRKKAQSEEDVSDANESGGVTSEESDDEPKNKKKKASNKVANNKSKAKTPATPAKGGRGRKPAAASAKKAAPTPKRGRKRKGSSEEESEHKEEEEGSSSEDEPLAKKTKSAQPPTDDEIKTYVKEILDGANLEEITMKTVCKQVYAHYPDFDLAHKKDFIKTTVKSLIST